MSRETQTQQTGTAEGVSSAAMAGSAAPGTEPEAGHLDALLARFWAAVQQIIDGLQREQR